MAYYCWLRWYIKLIQRPTASKFITHKQYYSLVCGLMRSNLGWPPAPFFAALSCLAYFGVVTLSHLITIFFGSIDGDFNALIFVPPMAVCINKADQCSSFSPLSFFVFSTFSSEVKIKKRQEEIMKSHRQKANRKSVW